MQFYKGAALLIFTILIISLFSCQKKENVKPVPNPPKKTDTSVIQTMVYPYTDTFIGNFTEVQSIVDLAGSGSGPYTIDTAVVFYIEYLNAKTMVFISGDSIRYEYGAFMVRDTFTASPLEDYVTVADTSRKHEYAGDVFTYSNGSVVMSYSWSFYEPAGCTDIMLHSRTYWGRELHK